MNPKMTGYLHRALNHEMSAVQLYLTQATLCELWGLSDAAARFQFESKDELGHAQRIIGHMLGLGLLPNNTQLPAVRATHSLYDMLIADWHVEAEAIRLYSEISEYCLRIGDEPSYRLFFDLLQEEKEHLASLEKWLDELKASGSTHG